MQGRSLQTTKYIAFYLDSHGSLLSILYTLPPLFLLKCIADVTDANMKESTHEILNDTARPREDNSLPSLSPLICFPIHQDYTKL